MSSGSAAGSRGLRPAALREGAPLCPEPRRRLQSSHAERRGPGAPRPRPGVAALPLAAAVRPRSVPGSSAAQLT